MSNLLNTHAMLVSLHVSFPSGRRKDLAVSKEIAASYDVEERVGTYSKRLFPYYPALDLVQKKAASIRVDFYARTLAYTTNGSQMLPNKKYFEFVEWFSKQKDAYNVLVRDAIDQFDAACAYAKTSLKGMWNPAEYPSKQEFAAAFDIRIDVMPFPDSNYLFNTFASDIAADAEARLKETMEEAGKAASNDFVGRILKTVGHLASRLTDPETKFKDATVENVRKIVDEAADWNVTENEDITNIVEEIRTKLTLYHPDTLRNDMEARAEAVKKAEAILEKLQGCFQ